MNVTQSECIATLPLMLPAGGSIRVRIVCSIIVRVAAGSNIHRFIQRRCNTARFIARARFQIIIVHQLVGVIIHHVLVVVLVHMFRFFVHWCVAILRTAAHNPQLLIIITRVGGTTAANLHVHDIHRVTVVLFTGTNEVTTTIGFTFTRITARQLSWAAPFAFLLRECRTEQWIRLHHLLVLLEQTVAVATRYDTGGGEQGRKLLQMSAGRTGLHLTGTGHNTRRYRNTVGCWRATIIIVIVHVRYTVTAAVFLRVRARDRITSNSSRTGTL
uniref:Uncharacterized protein n=1 Tax=Anopheles culicifacies TaxID=139723 RepID=A0A182M3R6_9DIPT